MSTLNTPPTGTAGADTNGAAAAPKVDTTADTTHTASATSGSSGSGSPILPKKPATASATPTWSDFVEGLWRQNPVFVMLLGMCPALAVTVSAVNALAMGAATTFVLVCSCALISLIARWVPKEVRIATYIVIIATFVTVVDYAIQAISLALYEALGAFIQLIVVNCIILGRAEAHASKQPLAKAVINAFGMGLGFTIGLFALGAVREILGAGTLFGVTLFGPNFQPWVVMVLPPGGFFVLGGWLLIFAWWARRRQPLAFDAALHAGGSAR